MAERVRVRRLNDEEGRQLQRIVRRGGGGKEKSIVRWRRAMVVLASAGGNDVAAIARLVQTSPDRVREMIRRFNEMGMDSLDPQWAGGRPRLITTTDRELIVKTAVKRPRSLGQPFTRWSLRKFAGYLATRIAGAAPMRQPAAPVVQLPFNEIKELQQHLVRAGFNVGKVDGVLGQQSRTAVKAMQVKYGLPADSWPTADLLARMRGGPRPGAMN